MHDGQSSDIQPVPHGVPQGSVIGPILFSLYTAPICDIVSSHGIQFHLYADDTQIFLRFSPKSSPSAAVVCETLGACVKDIQDWMNANSLKLNDDKTEVLCMASPQLRSKVTISSV